MALPQGAVGCSAVCDCGISLSYSLTFCPNLFIYIPMLYTRNTSLTKSCVDLENSVGGGGGGGGGPDNIS